MTKHPWETIGPRKPRFRVLSQDEIKKMAEDILRHGADVGEEKNLVATAVDRDERIGRLESENRRLRQALEQYADIGNWGHGNDILWPDEWDMWMGAENNGYDLAQRALRGESRCEREGVLEPVEGSESVEVGDSDVLRSVGYDDGVHDA